MLLLFAGYLRRLIHKTVMGVRIHEHDFLPMEATSQFIQCRICDAAYCVLCGKRIAMIVTKHDHSAGKCIKSRQVMQSYEKGKEILQN